MKKVLLITSGYLPLPAVDGGAVENLTENYIRYNEKNPKYNFVTYSVKPKTVNCNEIENLTYTKFRFVNKSKYKDLIFKIFSKFFRNRIPNYFIYCINKDLKRRNEHYDIILVENNPKLVLQIKKKFGDSIVLHVHNDWLNKNSECSNRIVKRCDKILTVSHYVKKRVCEIHNCDEKKVKVVMNGIENERFKRIKDNSINAKTREKYNINADDLVMLFTGKLNQEKGALEVITAFCDVCKKCSNIKLLMVGSSFNKADKDTPYIIKIKEMVKNNKNIIFTGFVDYNEIHKLYSIADIQIVPSIVEDSCPLVVIEGMSAGLAIIATISGGIPELVNEKCSFLLERDSNLAMNISLKMEELINNKNLLNKMKNESFNKSLNFSNEKFCKFFLLELDK